MIPRDGESGNVTYTISNNPPPISSQVFLQLPADEELRRQPDRVYTKFESRRFKGDLIFDITHAAPSIDGSGQYQFEIGEVLSFSDVPQDTSNPFQLQSVELRQDLNAIDYEKYGLSVEDISVLKSESAKQQDAIASNIAKLTSMLNNNGSEVSRNQSDINQITKLIDNSSAVLGASNNITISLQNKFEEFQKEKAELQKQREELQSQIDELRDRLNSVREVVR